MGKRTQSAGLSEATFASPRFVSIRATLSNFVAALLSSALERLAGGKANEAHRPSEQ